MNNTNIESIYTLTPMQEGILFHCLRDREQYFDQYSCKLRGNLDAENLIKAWEILVSENAVFRTAFVWENVKDPVQVVLRNRELHFMQYDWRDLPEEKQAEKLKTLLEEDKELGFRLDSPPLTRLSLIRVSRNAWYFVWSIHHMIIDGMSLPLILRQVYENYRNLCGGLQPPVHSSLPFKAYADWIRRQDRKAALDYWSGYLGDFTEPVRIVSGSPGNLGTSGGNGGPGSSEGPANHGSTASSVSSSSQGSQGGQGCLGSGRAQGENRRFTLPVAASLVKRLEEKAKLHGMAVFQFYNLAYALLISKFSGRNDVVYGLTVSGRPLNLKGVNETIGIFINTVPARMRFDGDKSIRTYMESAVMDQIDRNSYEYLPLTDIISAVDAGKELFQSIFIYENYSIENYYGDSSIGFTISDEHITESTNYPLTWIVRPGRSTEVNAVYNSALIDEECIASLSEAYVHLLEKLTEDTETSAGRLLAGIGPISENRLFRKKDVPGGNGLGKKISDGTPEIGVARPSGHEEDTGSAGQDGDARPSSQDGDARQAGSSGNTRRAPTPPEIDTERTVRAIWKEVLNKTDLGAEDNFFDLGGNSVGIMRVVSRIMSALKTSCTIDDLFAYPTVRQISAVLDERIRRAGVVRSVEKPVITEAEKLYGVQASYAQQRFWFLHQYDGGDVFYNVSEVVKLTGVIDTEALRKTVGYIAERHEILRTVFSMKNGTVYQRILASCPGGLSLADLRDIGQEGGRDEAVSDFIYKEISKPFDFENGPLFRCTLLKLTESEHIFILVMHHIISDGWSLGIFIDELTAAYQAFRSAGQPKLPDVQWQYGEYSVWQRNMLAGGAMEKQRTYWEKQLEGADELNFPLDFDRPVLQSFSGRKTVFTYKRELTDKVMEASRSTDATPFMVLLAALDVLLSRYSGQEDIVIGSPVTSRPLKEVEHTIGCFLNTLVFRNDLSGNPTFAELIGRVRKNSLDAYNNQDIPFEMLVDKLGVKRDLSKNPLFQIMFLFQNEPHPGEDMPGLKIERLRSENKSAMLDLSISMQEVEDGMSALFEYNTDLFRPETIQRIARHLERVVDILCSDVNRRIKDFDYMTEEEINHVIYELNETGYKFDTDLYIHQLFEEQAMKHPDRTALRFRGRGMTYGLLNTRINRLANYLLSAGVKKNQLVAVYMDRSFEMIIALYGILKAGAAYVPLDPEFPRERIKYMLEDSGAELVLTQEDKAEALGEYSRRVVVLGENDATASMSGENPEVEIKEDDYAYMIYTSGSTGLPKGVINTHKGIRNRILWIRTISLIPEDACQMQKTPYSFDVSLGEIFGSLTVGARLVIAEPGGHKDVDYLIDLINSEGITHVHFVPSMLRLFLYSPRITEVRGLKQVCCTGEPLPFSLVERYKQLFPGCELYNLYGPTEAAVEVTYWDCRNKLDRDIISIGRPMVNTQIYILDKNKRPVPTGVLGEMYIAGDNLAAGYHRKEGLTAERFVENPFSTGGNPRMYRTGDYARRLAGGELEFIGRIDNQVKIRGNRIELGDIENNISSYPDVIEANVIVSKEETPRIIAYITVDKACRADPGDAEFIIGLRRHLKGKLPGYMMPSFIMILEKMPLLTNGKLNMKALPIPAVSREYIANAYTEASGDTEIRLKEIWSSVLGISQIGADDNFFEMGGHSLLIIQVYYKIKEIFDTDLTVVDMFRYPTIRSLGERIADPAKNRGAGDGALARESEAVRAGRTEKLKNNERLRKLRLK